ncbi:MAG: hypothetical protein JOZ52_05045 [Acidobacteria bacterium]|nr:hypothetical protein [Acidobacteriota bacterium]
MSYLDPPRMHFSGQFWTNPSTINNATENYSLDEVYNNEPPSDVNPNSVWWNEDGQAFFKIPSAAVTEAVGSQDQSMPDDPIIGAQIVSVIAPADGASPTPQYGRLVDLDPDQQARSMIVGLRLQLTIPTEPNVSLSGTLRPMCIIDLWGRVAGGGGGGGIFSAGAMYQSVMEDLVWNGIDDSSSEFLKELYQTSPDALSFKMVVDGYNGEPKDDGFASGRVVGTIGPYFNGEPAHFLAKRRVFPGAEAVLKYYPPPYTQTNPPPPLNPAPFQVNGTKLVIDLGNSVPTTAPLGGPFMNLGTVNAVIDPLGANIVLQPPLFSTPDEYAQQYTQTAGIFELELGDNASRLQSIVQDGTVQDGTPQGAPLGIQISPPSATESAITGLSARQLKSGLTASQIADKPASSPPATTIALAEWQSGIFVEVDFNALRLQNGAPAWDTNALSGTEITADAQIPLVATVWGQPPNSEMTINLQVAQNQYQFRNDEGELYNINNSPMSCITWPQSVQTDKNGLATVSFTANSLSPEQKPARRASVDGQLYLFSLQYSMDLSGQDITLLVFEDSPYVASPTWWQDVQPIFLQYARLYPAMRDLIDLSDYASVTNTDFDIPNKIQMVFNLPMTHPGYMPVTRDLSTLKREMILRWFANGMPEGTQPPNA